MDGKQKTEIDPAGIRVELLPAGDIVTNPRMLRLKSTGASPELKASLRQYGQRTPLETTAEDPPRLLHGHSRLEILRELGIPLVAVRRFPAEDSFLMLEILGEAYGITGKSAPWQKWRLLEGVCYLHSPGNNKTREELARRLGLRPEHLEILDRLRDFPTFLHEQLERQEPGLKTLERLVSVPRALLEALSREAAALGLKVKTWPEILLQIREWALKTGVDPLPALEKLLSQARDDAQTPQRRREHFQNRLLRLTHPRLSQMRDRIQSELEALHPPAGVELRWDPWLEQPGLEIRIRVSRDRDWLKAKNWIADTDLENRLNTLRDLLG
jgi:hypothetical protein